MIPVEFFWIALVIVFGFVGSARGLAKELGGTTILLLSLFVLKFAWTRLGEKGLALVGDRAPEATVMALYYAAVIVFVAFISYEGFSLAFPVKQLKGVAKGMLGFLGGLLNGYLIVGSIWDVVAKADYFGREVPFECYDTALAISKCLTELHQAIVPYLPVTFINEFVMLVLGMILLLAIVFR